MLVLQQKQKIKSKAGFSAKLFPILSTLQWSQNEPLDSAHFGVTVLKNGPVRV